MPVRTRNGQFKKGGKGNDNDLIVDLESASDTATNVMDIKMMDIKVIDIGVHMLVAAIAVAVLVIFVILPEFSHKPTLEIALDTLSMDDLVIVPNSCVKNNTKVDRLNRITGDHQTLNCQDRPQDDIVLARRDCIEGNITIMRQGDKVPMHAELLDTPWISQTGARARAEQMGYLIVV